jgi:hypothetical protein
MLSLMTLYETFFHTIDEDARNFFLFYDDSWTWGSVLCLGAVTATLSALLGGFIYVIVHFTSNPSSPVYISPTIGETQIEIAETEAKLAKLYTDNNLSPQTWDARLEDTKVVRSKAGVVSSFAPRRGIMRGGVTAQLFDPNLPPGMEWKADGGVMMRPDPPMVDRSPPWTKLDGPLPNKINERRGIDPQSHLGDIGNFQDSWASPVSRGKMQFWERSNTGIRPSGGMRPQFGTTSPAISKVMRNKYIIAIGDMPVANLTFYEASSALMNYHVWHSLPDVFRLYPFVTMGIEYYVIEKKTVTVLHELARGDKCFLNFPRVRAHADIHAHFATQAEIDAVISADAAWLTSYNRNMDEPEHSIATRVVHMKKELELKSSFTYTIDDYFLYNWDEAIAGSCGSTLFLKLGANVKIVGYHTAGKANTKVGVSTVVTQEELFLYSDKNKTETRCKAFDKLSDFRKISLIEESEAYSVNFDVEPQGVFITPISTQATDSTVFVPSPFQDFSLMVGPLKYLPI